MKCALIFALLLPSLASAQSLSTQIEKPLLTSGSWAIVIGNALDLTSTELALRRVGVKEGNPIMGQSSTQRIVLKSAGTAATVWLLKKIERRHPRLARVAGYSMGGVTSLVAAHNFRMGQ